MACRGPRANPDLAPLVATPKCDLGGLHFLRSASGEVCGASTEPGICEGLVYGAPTEPGIGRGLLRAKSPKKFFSGATPPLNYRHMPPQLPASFEPLKAICGDTPDHAWNPQSSTPQPARLTTPHAPLTTLCRSTMHMATTRPLITRLTCPRPPRPSCPCSYPLILTHDIKFDINTLLTSTYTYHHSIRHHQIALF